MKLKAKGKKSEFEYLGWKTPPEPTDPEGVGTLYEPKKEPSLLVTINGLVRIWRDKRPEGINPKFIYIPGGLEPRLRDEIAELKGAKVAMITKLNLSVGWVSVVIFKPREGPRYVYDDSSIFLK
jgi:hypothetical protein